MSQWRMQEREDGADVHCEQYRVADVSCIEDAKEIVAAHNLLPLISTAIKPFIAALDALESEEETDGTKFDIPDSEEIWCSSFEDVWLTVGNLRALRELARALLARQGATA